MRNDLAKMTVGELLSALEQGDTETANEVLADFLRLAVLAYRERESHICQWALYIALSAVQADGFDEADYKRITDGMAKLAMFLLSLDEELEVLRSMSTATRRRLEAVAPKEAVN